MSMKTGYDIANEIRMLRSRLVGVFLIVEGETADFRFYTHLIDQKRCHIVPACQKKAACDALGLLEKQGFTGVIAIVDTDFWELNGETPASSNLFTTDTHDLETMILQSPALEKLLLEFASIQKVREFVEKHGIDIRTSLLRCASPIGYLRWASEKHGWSLDFEDISFRQFLNDHLLEVRMLDLIRTVKNKSRRFELNDQEIAGIVQSLVSEEYDLWHVCCGHDMVEILSVSLRKCWGTHNSKNVAVEGIEIALRLAYESAFFCETRLYRKLKAWENKNKEYAVLRDNLC